MSKFRSKILKASLISLTLSLFSDKVRCFNQSERALYGNFIIKNYMRNGITFTSQGPVLECKHSAPVGVYLCFNF